MQPVFYSAVIQFIISNEPFDMSDIKTPQPVKLFVGLLTSLPDNIPAVEKKLSQLFGAIDGRSELFPFDKTDYYNESMGSPLYRYFISFLNLIEPSTIAEAKKTTNHLESEFAHVQNSVQRPVNLDPGYVEQSKIVLASTKNFFHRILVSGGIYAEVTLHYQSGEWHDFPWTFPDFKTDRYHPFFTSLRNAYRKQLNDMGFQIRLRRS
jgi:hypothetical protein